MALYTCVDKKSANMTLDFKLYGMGPFGSLQGHHSLQTASEIKSDLRFQISDLNYICNQSFKVSLLVEK